MAGKRAGLILAAVAVTAALAAWLLRPRVDSPGPLSMQTGGVREHLASNPVGSPAPLGDHPGSLNAAAPRPSGEALNLLGSVQSGAQATLTTRIPLLIRAVLVQ